MHLAILATVFASMFCVGILASPNYLPWKCLLALRLALVSVIAEAQDPQMVYFVRLPYEALGIAVLLAGLCWICSRLLSFLGR